MKVGFNLMVLQRTPRHILLTLLVHLIALIAVLTFIAESFINPHYQLILHADLPLGESVLQQYRTDLDGDQTPDWIYLKIQGEKSPVSTVLVGNSRQIIHEWKLPGNWIPQSDHIYIHDANSDGLMEIYCFTAEKGKVLLTKLDIRDKNESTVFIDTISSQYDHQDIKLHVAGSYASSLYFSVNAGYGLTPRSVYKYDIISKMVIKQKDQGSIVNSPYFFDIDQDSVPEILTRSYAPENIHDSTTYSDSHAWLRVFQSHDLDHHLPPIGFRGIGSNVFVNPLKTDSGNFLLVSAKQSNANQYQIGILTGTGRWRNLREVQNHMTLFATDQRLLALDHHLRVLCELSPQLEKTQTLKWPIDGLNFKNVLRPSLSWLTLISHEQSNLWMLDHSGRVATYDVGEYINEIKLMDQVVQVNTTNRYLEITGLSLHIPWKLFIAFMVIFCSAMLFLYFGQIRQVKHDPLPAFYVIKSKKDYKQFLFDEILYFESSGGGPYSYLVDIRLERHLISKHLKAIKDEVPESFARIDRRILLNTSHMKAVDQNNKKISIHHTSEIFTYSKKYEMNVKVQLEKRDFH